MAQAVPPVFWPFALLLLLVCTLSQAHADCQVTIAQGAARGSVMTSFRGRDFCSYRGIRYAEPPVGELRFKVSLNGLLLYCCTWSVREGACGVALSVVHILIDCPEKIRLHRACVLDFKIEITIISVVKFMCYSEKCSQASAHQIVDNMRRIAC